MASMLCRHCRRWATQIGNAGRARPRNVHGSAWLDGSVMTSRSGSVVMKEEAEAFLVKLDARHAHGVTTQTSPPFLGAGVLATKNGSLLMQEEATAFLAKLENLNESMTSGEQGSVRAHPHSHAPTFHRPDGQGMWISETMFGAVTRQASPASSTPHDRPQTGVCSLTEEKQWRSGADEMPSERYIPSLS